MPRGPRRKSRHREAVLQHVRRGSSHVAADEIYQALRREGSSISLGTVYRNLGILEAQGRLRRLEWFSASGRPESRYDANTIPHAHLHCVQCGLLQDVDAARSADMEQALRQLGYEFRSYSLILEVHCPRCQEAPA